VIETRCILVLKLSTTNEELHMKNRQHMDLPMIGGNLAIIWQANTIVHHFRAG